MGSHTNKVFATAAAAMLLLPVVAAPSTFARPAKATAKLIWFMRTDPNETAWEKAQTDAWNKAHPDIQVTLITAPNPNGQFDLKFNQLLQSGTAADIWSHLGQDGYYDYYYRGLLLNLSPYIKSTGYSFGATPKNLVNTYAQPDGGIYGIPSITLGSYLYYNKDIFDAYNKANPSAKIAYPPVNWDDKSWTYDKMISIAKKLTGLKIQTSSGSSVSYGYYDGKWPPMATAFEAGTDMFPKGAYTTGKPAAVNLTDPAIVKAYQQNADNYLTLKVSPTYSKVKQISNSGSEPFQFGNVAMESTGGWGFRNFRTAKFHWAAAAYPYRVTNTDVLFTDPYFVNKKTKYPKEAMQFIAYLTGKDAMTSYIKNVGFTPSNPDNLGLWYSTYQGITGMSQKDLTTLVSGARKYGVESPNHLIVNFSQITNTGLQPYLDQIYYGKASVASSLQQAQSKVNSILAQSAG